MECAVGDEQVTMRLPHARMAVYLVEAPRERSVPFNPDRSFGRRPPGRNPAASIEAAAVFENDSAISRVPWQRGYRFGLSRRDREAGLRTGSAPTVRAPRGAR